MGLCFGIVSQSNVSLIETCGRFSRTEDPGCFCLIPCVQEVARTINLKQHQYIIRVDTKTKDDVFCVIKVAIFYAVKRAQVQNLVYEIGNYQDMMDSSVQDIVRSILSLYTLDDAFREKNALSDAVRTQLTNQYSNFGLTINNVLINDIEPDPKVRSAMNEKQAQERLRHAQLAKAEAEKATLIAAAEANAIASVRNAEADAQVKILAGQGIAGQRREIAAGFGRSIEEVKKLNPQLDENLITNMIQNMLYVDMLKSVGSSSKSNIVFLPANNEIKMEETLIPVLSKKME